MIETLPPLAPSEVLDYRIDATGLLESGETLTEAGSSITVSGATKDSQDFESDGVTVWLSGAAAGTTVRVTAVLKTSGGRTAQRVYVIPYGEPVSLELAKEYCRVDEGATEEDEAIALLIRAARVHIEKITGCILVRRTVEDEHSGCARFFDLYKRPFDPETIEIVYTDVDGAVQSATDVTVNGNRIYPAFNSWWPTTRYGTPVRVRYTAGFEDGDPEADDLIVAVLMLTAHWFANREAVNIGSAPSELPFTVKALCEPHRIPMI